MKIYVGNLPFSHESGDLKTMFGPFGEIVSAEVVTDRDTGRSRGFGFVEMSNSDEARAAIEDLDGKDLGGRRLNVNEAKPRENRGGGGGGGRDRSGPARRW